MPSRVLNLVKLAKPIKFIWSLIHSNSAVIFWFMPGTDDVYMGSLINYLFYLLNGHCFEMWWKNIIIILL